MKGFKVVKLGPYNISWVRVLIFLVLFLWLLAFFIFDGSESEGPSTEVEYATITHDKYNFSIDYPTKWRVATSDKEGKWYDNTVKLELYVAPKNPFGIFIRHKTLERSPTLQDVSEWGTVVMSRIGTRENIVEYPDIVNGKHVIRQRYDWGSYTTENVYIARSSDMIIISMNVKQYDYGANIDDFNAIVESFRPFE